jgi:hypothetical protein
MRRQITAGHAKSEKSEKFRMKSEKFVHPGRKSEKFKHNINFISFAKIIQEC